jgi:hypothetical protein
MSTLTNSKGDEIAVSTTEHTELLTPAPENGVAQRFAETLRVWNTGATDIRISINEEEADFTVATAGLIPAGEDTYFVSTRKPIKKFIVATESGTSTVKYTAF